MAELNDETHIEIQRLCSEGGANAGNRRFSKALELYWAAWDLLPEPKINWDASTWILAAIGDANFLGGDFVAGRDNLSNAMRCPRAIGNPFLHLRLGQCQLELGAEGRAIDELMRAYMGAGPKIFEGQDSKYIRLVQSKATGVNAPKKKWKFWE